MHESIRIRKITPADDRAISLILRIVMTEFDLAESDYFKTDPEIDNISTYYTVPGGNYFVAEENGVILGGGGILPLPGFPGICELSKMYFLEEARGKGLGTRMLNECLTEARKLGYKKCYLETMNTMTKARELYRKAGFESCTEPMSRWGQSACTNYLIREL